MNQRTDDNWRSILLSRHEAKELGRESEWLRQPPPAATGETPRTLAALNKSHGIAFYGPLLAECDQLERELAEAKADGTRWLTEKYAAEQALEQQSSTGAPVAWESVLRGLTDDCPNCANVGWYVRRGTDPEQEQCEWCYTTKNSRFNIEQSIAANPLYAAPQGTPAEGGKPTWYEVEYDETEWSSEPREGDVFWHSSTAFTVKTRGRLWRIDLPPFPDAAPSGPDDAGSKGA